MGLVKGRTATKARTEERDKIRRVRRRTVVQQPSQALDKRTIESVGKRALRTPSPLSCGCVVKGTNGPSCYYDQLGASDSIAGLRILFQHLAGVPESDVRVEEIVSCRREGKSSSGCPVAKEIIRRLAAKEKLLVVAKHCQGHSCNASYIAVAIVVWEAVDPARSDELYAKLKFVLPTYGLSSERQCEMNASRTCACQGGNVDWEGASYSFGCSWSMFTNGCKFGQRRSGLPRKFLLKNRAEEVGLEAEMDLLADELSVLLEKLTPVAFERLTAFSAQASKCRIGKRHDLLRPFSGVTGVLDFSAHSHRDRNDLLGGCTMVLTLTKPDQDPDSVRPDEQLHVLPMYRLADQSKSATSGIDHLNEFFQLQGTRVTPRKKRNDGKRNQSKTAWPSLIASAKKYQPASNFTNCPEQILHVNGADSNIEPLLSEKFTEDYIVYKRTKNEDIFGPENVDIGGVGLALNHGSILIENSRMELHASTPLIDPDRFNPSRIGLVFYQHHKLSAPDHGSDYCRQKMRKKLSREEDFRHSRIHILLDSKPG